MPTLANSAPSYPCLTCAQGSSSADERGAVSLCIPADWLPQGCSALPGRGDSRVYSRDRLQLGHALFIVLLAHAHRQPHL